MVTPQPGKRKAQLPALTGIRFLAALHVVLFHYATDALSTAHWSVRALLASGPSAVGLFYVLSGTVLAYSCTTDTGELSATRASFWRARFARIYPTYLLALLLDLPFFVSAVVKVHTGVDAVLWGIGLALPVLLLVHAWMPLTVFAWNTPGWSLSAEAFFYATFPSVAGRLRCRSLPQLLLRASVFYFFALIPPVLVIWARESSSPVMQLQVPSGPGGLDVFTWIVRFCGFSPLARLPEFMIGICLGHWLRARQRHSPAITVLQASALEAFAVVALAAALIVLGSQPSSRPWLDSGLLSPLFALLISVLAIGSGPLARLLSARPMQIAGDASYAMYILQEPVLIWLLHFPLVGVFPVQAFVPVFVAVLIGVSIVCQRFVAEPSRMWLLARQRGVLSKNPKELC